MNLKFDSDEKEKIRSTQYREVDYESRASVLEGLRLRTDKRHGGEGFYNYIEKAIANSIASRYVDLVRRAELLEKIKRSADGRQGGTNLRNRSEKALTQNQRFLEKKGAAKAI